MGLILRKEEDGLLCVVVRSRCPRSVDTTRPPLRKYSKPNTVHWISVTQGAYGGAGRRGLSGAFRLGLEGILSKRIGSHYRSGRSPDWLKFKNPEAPAVKREAEEDWER